MFEALAFEAEALGEVLAAAQSGHIVTEGAEAAIGFVFLCDLCDSARAMKPNEITAQIVEAACPIHPQLGPGLLETAP
ncbi:MAG: hypothetical protein ABSG04_12270, partial [Verrucomicrobiota bacterium]